jgi:aryl-alcohol dehydrogenase-like predicted oxidoreductase
LGGRPIALYYLHAVDPAVPLADSLGELVRLKQEGKILHIGLSNVSAQQLHAARRLTPIAAVQNRCNVLERRDVYSGLVEQCRRDGISYVAYSPVGGHFGHRRLAKHATLARIAAKHGASPYVIALAWLLSLGPHVLPIPGASKVTSARDSARAADIVLDPADCAALVAG